jgi:hypothetical protein
MEDRLVCLLELLFVIVYWELVCILRLYVVIGTFILGMSLAYVGPQGIVNHGAFVQDTGRGKSSV